MRRSTSTTARSSSTGARWTCATVCCAGPPSGSHRAAARCGSRAPGWSRCPAARSPPSSTRWRSPTSSATSTWPSSQTCWPTSCSAPRATIRGRRPPWTGRCCPRWRSPAASTPSSCTGPGAAASGWRPAWTTPSRSPTPARRTSRPAATWPGTPSPPGSRPAARCGWRRLSPPDGRRGRRPAPPPRRWGRGSPRPTRDQVEAALATAKLAGWDRLVREQRELLDQHWDEADVEIEGDDELQQAVRVGMFHVLQAGLRGERQPIPAKGLTGPGYDGHTFWDTETYVLPVLTYTAPHAVRDALRWRHSILDKARARARELGLQGAAFPWRTINGEETSGYWPAGTAAFHINADIADAVVRYWNATLDEAFDRDFGAELLIETARLWASLGHFDIEHGFRIDGVTGPDEYTAVVDNNVYTNLMAQRNLREAAEAVRRQ